jgi:hypothetical protein
MRICGDVESINPSTGKRLFRVTGDGESRLFAVKTSFVCPPIPIRCMDWQAWLDGCEENGPYGTGSTEAEAVGDLKESIEL